MISIIMAAYNCGESIEKALESVFSQTLSGKHYETIVVNDGSTDNTEDVLKKYRDRIKVINQSNQGLAAACNRGIQEARGDYLIRLDADDYFAEDILSLTWNVLKTRPDYQYVYTDRYEVDSQRNTTVKISTGKDNIFDMLGCGILFRREVFDKVGTYRDLLFEEYDLMLRLYENGMKGYYLPQPLYYYVKHGAGMTDKPNYWKDGWQQLVELWGEEKLKKYVRTKVESRGTREFRPA